jgi:hypothetical protein
VRCNNQATSSLSKESESSTCPEEEEEQLFSFSSNLKLLNHQDLQELNLRDHNFLGILPNQGCHIL